MPMKKEGKGGEVLHFRSSIDEQRTANRGNRPKSFAWNRQVIYNEETNLD